MMEATLKTVIAAAIKIAPAVIAVAGLTAHVFTIAACLVAAFALRQTWILANG